MTRLKKSVQLPCDPFFVGTMLGRNLLYTTHTWNAKLNTETCRRVDALIKLGRFCFWYSEFDIEIILWVDMRKLTADKHPHFETNGMSSALLDEGVPELTAVMVNMTNIGKPWLMIKRHPRSWFGKALPNCTQAYIVSKNSDRSTSLTHQKTCTKKQSGLQAKGTHIYAEM